MFWAFLASLPVLTSVHADTLELGAGIQVDGKLIRRTDGGPKPHVILEMDSGLRAAIPQSRIRKAIRDEDLTWYKSQLETVGDDAEAHYQLGRKCKANRLPAQCDYHFRRAIEIDPDHSKARQALRYARDGNDWILFEELQRQRGMINVHSGWEVPEVYAREKMREEAKEASLVWKNQFLKLRNLYLRGGKRSAEALESIIAIDDPLASLAFADALEDSRGNDLDTRSMRQMYVKKLGSFKTSVAVQALVKAGLAEPDSEVRAMALDQLKEYGAESAVASYLPILSAEKHTPAEVNAALYALNHFPDPELWEHYVDALITEYKTVQAPGPGMQAGRNSLGGMGLAMGGKPEVETNYTRNAGALELLKQIAPGVDFRYDQAAWRSFFAEQLMQSPGDLRRDP
jgi:HEAT repeat protein